MIWRKRESKYSTSWIECYVGNVPVGKVRQVFYRDRFQPFVPSCSLPDSPNDLGFSTDKPEAMLVVEQAVREWFLQAGIPLEEEPWTNGTN